MRNIFAILQKELRSYFSSPVAWGLMAFFALLTGYMFYVSVAVFVSRGLEGQMMGRGIPMDMNEWVIRPVLDNVSVIGLFLIPLITMRLFAEEKNRGTIELLVTSPVSDTEIILGKWLSALVLYAAIISLSLINIAILFLYGKPDLGPILTGYLGLLLQGGTLLAIGTLISTMTRNQIVAAFATFAVCLLLWVLAYVTAFNSEPWAKALAYASVITHYEPFAKGVIDTKDAFFYVSMIFFALFLTARSLESLRWRA